MQRLNRFVYITLNCYVVILYNLGGISFSGTAFDCWTQAENSKEKAQKLSALMGCPTTSSRDMIRCLRHRPARVMVQATSEFMVKLIFFLLLS